MPILVDVAGAAVPASPAVPMAGAGDARTAARSGADPGETFDAQLDSALAVPGGQAADGRARPKGAAHKGKTLEPSAGDGDARKDGQQETPVGAFILAPWMPMAPVPEVTRDAHRASEVTAGDAGGAERADADARLADWPAPSGSAADSPALVASVGAMPVASMPAALPDTAPQVSPADAAMPVLNAPAIDLPAASAAAATVPGTTPAMAPAATAATTAAAASASSLAPATATADNATVVSRQASDRLTPSTPPQASGRSTTAAPVSQQRPAAPPVTKSKSDSALLTPAGTDAQSTPVPTPPQDVLVAAEGGSATTAAVADDAATIRNADPGIVDVPGAETAAVEHRAPQPRPMAAADGPGAGSANRPVEAGEVAALRSGPPPDGEKKPEVPRGVRSPRAVAAPASGSEAAAPRPLDDAGSEVEAPPGRAHEPARRVDERPASLQDVPAFVKDFAVPAHEAPPAVPPPAAHHAAAAVAVTPVLPPVVYADAWVPPAPAGSPLGDVPDADTPDRLVQSMRMQFLRGGGDAIVQLRPEHLGPVTVSLRVEQGGVSARILAADPVVAEWLHAHQDTLREGLQSSGLSLDRLVIDRDGRSPDRRERREPPARPRHRVSSERQSTFELTI